MAMNIFIENHRMVLKKMTEKKVDLMLIGGYAENYYDFNRVTGNLDIWIRPDNNNKLLLSDASETNSLPIEKKCIILIE